MEDTRMIDLEIRFTHQEASLQALNDVVADQQRLIDQLRKQVETLKCQLHEVIPFNIAPPGDETPPPHY